MTKPAAQTPLSARSDLSAVLTEPLLSLSSIPLGWDGLIVQAFHEPAELEGWRIQATPEPSLVLFTGGAMHIERKLAEGSWKGGDIHPGELVLNWGVDSAYEVRWTSLSSIPTQTLHLQMSRDLVRRVAEEVAGVDLASLELVRRVGFRDPLLTQLALALWRELEQPVPAGNLYAQSAAQMIVVHLIRHYASRSTAVKTASSPSRRLTPHQSKQVIEFIKAHLSENISLDSLAQQIGFSSSHFARLFRRATGVSPYQMVLRLRLERAQTLLSETELPLIQVAHACGFADQSHLTQVFKQQHGLTPRIYRQEHSTRATF